MNEPPILQRLESPLGDLCIVATREALLAVYFADQRRVPAPARGAVADAPSPIARRTAAALAAYFGGDLAPFDAPLAIQGTAFQRRVWAALLDVPYGATATYGEIARRIGAPQAMRAVGAAIGCNPVAIVIPCHRVIGADGTLTGYAGGLERKRGLLALERRGTQAELAYAA